MSHSYSRTSAGNNLPGFFPVWSRPAAGPSPHRGLVRRFLRGALSPEKRVPVADAACGLPGLAHLLQVFPAMERATRPGEVFHSGAGLKKNRLAQPGEAMVGKNGPASTGCFRRAGRLFLTVGPATHTRCWTVRVRAPSSARSTGNSRSRYISATPGGGTRFPMLHLQCTCGSRDARTGCLSF